MTAHHRILEIQASENSPLSYIEYQTHAAHEVPQFTIIWLHGLGDSGHGWLPAVRMLHLNTPTRFILPHAPARPITVNGGYIMPGWYDIASMDFRDRGDERGIRTSAHHISALIDNEIANGIPSTNIFIAGFSQGGAIALHTGLRYPFRLGGILALSTYLPLQNTVSNEAHSANAATPIAMMHGIHDTVIPITIGKDTYSYLNTQGYPVTWKSYSMAHEACQEELSDIHNWLNTQFSR